MAAVAAAAVVAAAAAVAAAGQVVSSPAAGAPAEVAPRRPRSADPNAHTFTDTFFLFRNFYFSRRK